MSAVLPAQARVVVAGDFNDWRRRAHDVLKHGAGLQEVFVQAHGKAALTFPGAMLFNRSAVYSLLVDDLLPNTVYSVQLYACNAAGCVMASQTDSLV